MVFSFSRKTQILPARSLCTRHRHRRCGFPRPRIRHSSNRIYRHRRSCGYDRAVPRERARADRTEISRWPDRRRRSRGFRDHRQFDGQRHGHLPARPRRLSGPDRMGRREIPRPRRRLPPSRCDFRRDGHNPPRTRAPHVGFPRTHVRRHRRPSHRLRRCVVHRTPAVFRNPSAFEKLHRFLLWKTG